MQEEVENKVVLIIQGTSRLTANVLKSAMAKALADMKQKHEKKAAKKEAKKEAAKAEGPHGQMTVKELAAKDRGLQSVEVSKDNIGSFNKIARKYGVEMPITKAVDDIISGRLSAMDAVQQLMGRSYKAEVPLTAVCGDQKTASKE